MFSYRKMFFYGRKCCNGVRWKAIAPEVPRQVLLEPLEMPVQPLPDLAGPVVVDHAGGVQRNQHLIAEGLVDLPVSDVRGIDGPHLAPFAQREMDTFLRFPSSLQDFPPPAGGAGKEV